PADEPDRGHAGTPAVDRLLLGLADPRMVREPAIVVGGQHAALPAAPARPGVLRRVEHELFLVRAGLLELRHLGGEVVDEAGDGNHSCSDRIFPATRSPGKAASSAGGARSKAAASGAMISAQSVGRLMISDVPLAP